jgi:trans-2,3-dihydro-3-hydroxyanthranilate isomerase
MEEHGMEGKVFYIVDVFAEEKYAGNQLAVFRDTAGMSDCEMQDLAKEMNYSETTFILREEEDEGGYDVRIFTPDAEVPFAGHPTLGTACVIQQEIVGKPVDKVTLNLRVGQIPVSFTYDDQGMADTLWMRQKAPVAGKVVDRGIIASVLNLLASDIDDTFPVQEFSTGLPFIIVPLRNMQALRKSHVDRDKLYAMVDALEAKAVLCFSPETYRPEHDLAVRVFADYYGVPEDPATGSANGDLAGYLVHHRYFKKDEINISVGQGYEVGRPSLLMLKSRKLEDSIEVNVGGGVVMVAKGELL